MHPSTRIQEGFKFGGVVLPKIKISVFGAKMLSSPETPGISPETPGFEHSGGNSGYRPGNSGFGSPDTPRRCPDTPEMLSRILRVSVRIFWIFGLESEWW